MGITINISWEWALGIVGVLLVIAWKGSARFTALETSVDWIKGVLKDLKINTENNASATPVFTARSPLNLTQTGENWLIESGLKKYIDSHPDQFLDVCSSKKGANPYEVQKYIFHVFDQVQFESAFDDTLKKFAFHQGTTLDILRRIGAIYLRNVCLENFGMSKEDIDKHDPQQRGA
jgi:hypothetical protein